MKKVMTLLVAISFAGMLSAQTEKGKIVLMGGAGYNTNTTEYEDGTSNPSPPVKTNNGWVNFGAMYMLMDQLGLGLSLNMSNYTTLRDGKKTYSESLTGATVMGRYYAPCLAPRFYTFGQIDLSFAGGSNKQFDVDGNEIENDRDKVTQFGVGVRPGIAYFLTPSIMLEASFGAIAYNSTSYVNNQNNDIKETRNDLEFFAFSKSLTFGFCWWLGRKGQGW